MAADVSALFFGCRQDVALTLSARVREEACIVEVYRKPLKNPARTSHAAVCTCAKGFFEHWAPTCANNQIPPVKEQFF